MQNYWLLKQVVRVVTTGLWKVNFKNKRAQRNELFEREFSVNFKNMPLKYTACEKSFKNFFVVFRIRNLMSVVCSVWHGLCPPHTKHFLAWQNAWYSKLLAVASCEVLLCATKGPARAVCSWLTRASRYHWSFHPQPHSDLRLVSNIIINYEKTFPE
jgi:hypothetical protein